MRLTLLIEVMILFAVGGVSIVEGIRLTYGGKLQLYDIFGPGRYSLGMGVMLILVGVIYYFSQRKMVQEGGSETTPKEYKIKMVTIIATMALYIILMNIVGYFLSSLVFFILIIRIVGFKSWLTSLAVSVGMAISFYLIFVKCLNMIFPRGTLINLG